MFINLPGEKECNLRLCLDRYYLSVLGGFLGVVGGLYTDSLISMLFCSNGVQCSFFVSFHSFFVSFFDICAIGTISNLFECVLCNQ